MAVQDSDLLLVQRATTVHKLTTAGFRDYALRIATDKLLGAFMVGTGLKIDPATGILDVNLPGVLTFKGVQDFTAAKPGTYTPVVGDAWVSTTAGGAGTGWPGLVATTTPVAKDALLIYDGVKFVVAGDLGASVKPDWNAAINSATEILNKPTDLLRAVVSGAAPTGAALVDGALWLDTSVPAKPVLKRYVLATTSWADVGGVAPGTATFRGNADLTAAKPGATVPATGDLFVSSTGGVTADASWPGLAAGAAVAAGTVYYFNGTSMVPIYTLPAATAAIRGGVKIPANTGLALGGTGADELSLNISNLTALP